MLFDTDQLLDLEDKIKQELQDNLSSILSKLNRAGTLEKALDMFEMGHLLHTNSGYEPYKEGKIIVFGDSHVSAPDLQGTAKSLGISKDRIELYLDYEYVKRFDFRKLQYNPNYALILFGPVPHSGASKGDFGSVIENITHTQGFPPVKNLVSNEQLKITKSNFKQAIEEALDKGIIYKD